MIHYTGKKFFNPWPNAEPGSLGGVLLWSLERIGRKVPPAWSPTPVSPSPDLHSSPEHMRITWVGHSTFLVQIGRLNFLTDPIWSDRASPVQFAGPRRISPPGIGFLNLPEIHAILISHDHYDHLDSNTVLRLGRRYPGARWFVPLGVGKWLRERGVHEITEHDWDESSEWRGSRITCIPAQHFSGRTLASRDKTLWCGWIIRGNAGSVMFAGDTGLHPEFERLAKSHGPFGMVILPIGAYAPRWLMRPVHMDPDDAVAAYMSVVNVNPDNRCVFIPSHWGTFILTDEAAGEPPARLRTAWKTAGLPSDNCVILHPGGTYSHGP